MLYLNHLTMEEDMRIYLKAFWLFISVIFIFGGIILKETVVSPLAYLLCIPIGVGAFIKSVNFTFGRNDNPPSAN